MLTRNPTFEAPGKAHGFSLIELMISMLIGMIVMIGAVALIVAIDRSNSEMIQASRTNQELRALASIVGDEIKRSRHLHDPIAFVGQGGTTNGTFDFLDTSTAGCVLYGYQDATTNDSSVTSASNNYEAFYLKTTGGVGSIIFAKGTSAVNCTTSGTTISSLQLNITDLKFFCVSNGATVSDIANTSAADTQQVQETCSEIDMKITAKLVSGDTFENAISHTYVQQIFVRSGAAKTS